ncbi:MAG TPA: asparagine synthase-related protein [Candidatus Hydrogenedentes bacterium]|nr:asparagine synthase-related protein [Candidatus Hydrogenedentota bacterium]HOL75570.1 asparagine synthase-related protein [Candidatus Hydrogenedentota bacterium]HPO87005.1 asparagine synthase-related protein [Candidatus Hydrogenedentota bacterium]
MAFICGILGKSDKEIVRRILRESAPDVKDLAICEGSTYCIGSSDQCHALSVFDGFPRLSKGAVKASAASVDFDSASGGAVRSWRGAFAGALGSADGRQWVLLRDRIGRRPLYYYQGHGYVLFASSLKGLLASGVIQRRLDLTSVDSFLALGCVPGAATILQGIRKVLPGSRVFVTEGMVTREEVFADFLFEIKTYEKEYAAATIRMFLENALQFCEAKNLLWSAGIDCASLAVLKPGLLPLFVTLERGWQDESRTARESARWLGLPLNNVPARRLTEEFFFRVVCALQEPVADASILPYALIFDRVKDFGRLAISGQGADELLGGFPRFRYLQKARAARDLVPTVKMQELLPSLPPNAFLRRGGRYLAAIRDNSQAYLAVASIFDYTERKELYTDVMRVATEDKDWAHAAIQGCFEDTDLTRNVLALNIRFLLPNLLVAPSVRLSEAHGLGLEFPYLEDDFVDFVLTVSPSIKFGMRSKPLLRAAMKGLLPPSIRLRAQRSFRIPQGGRSAALIDSIAEKIITPERVDSTGMFRWNQVQHIIRSASHNVVRRRQFWALLLFFAWHREVMES